MVRRHIDQLPDLSLFLTEENQEALAVELIAVELEEATKRMDEACARLEAVCARQR
jgi:hypothetical protein